MTALTHQLIALLAAFWFLIQFPVSLGLIVGSFAIMAVMIGALTPDLDHPSANLWQRMLGGRALGNLFDAFSGGHRHMTHSLIGIGLIGYALWWLIHHFLQPEFVPAATALWVAYMIGYISHPIADTLTDMGVPWLWPFHFIFRIPPGPEQVRVTTDSWVERLLVRGGVIISLMLLLRSHWPIFLNLFR